MLVYGDRHELCDPTERIADIGDEIAEVALMPPGFERHSRLVSLLIETGRVLQGVEDSGEPPGELKLFLRRLAQSVVLSSDGRFAEFGDLPQTPSVRLRRWVELCEPEGFAFYAVYPEAYIEAARRLRLNGPPRVIGIRSIGTTLSAIVAATLGAPPPVTVRPFGNPFAREVELPPELIDKDAHYVIVDEGPGLSGSSFGSVADVLEQRGIPLERIAFLPSHAGDLGPAASDAHRERWRRAQRVPAEFDARFLQDRFGRLQEYSTGAPWERRKFLAWSNGTRVLLKFAGLGGIGERKLEIARQLHAEALAPEPIGLMHGFLVERWLEDARPLDPADVPIPEIARYIAARLRLPRGAPDSGAAIRDLLHMAKRNASLELGDDAARLLSRWDARVVDLEKRVLRIPTDNKLDRDEWLRTRDGALVKTDALDHHCGHDLIGCQGVAWDIAGAIVEFDLDHVSAAELIGAVERLGAGEVDRELILFSRLAYLAFRLGQARLGSGSTPHLNGAVARYAAGLAHLLQHNGSSKRLESVAD